MANAEYSAADLSLTWKSHCCQLGGQCSHGVQKFGLERAKVSTLFNDKAANVMAAGCTLEEEDSWANSTCGAHLLQTSVRHAFVSTRKVQVPLAVGRRLEFHFHHIALATELLNIMTLLS